MQNKTTASWIHHHTSDFNALILPAPENMYTSIFVNIKLAVENIQSWPGDLLRAEIDWLGNDVGCCLATNGSRFPALIQRRMDDAMLFHVVVEAETEIPVALSWLYFAQDEQDPSKVYVMANFLEIAAKYARHPELQQLIVKHLLHFTEQYARNIHAEAYLINHLQYGWIANFTCFEQKKIKPVKLGGCLHLTSSSNEANSMDVLQNLYFLPSLNQKKFHICNAILFAPEFSLTQTSSHVDTIEPDSQTIAASDQDMVQLADQIRNAETWIELTYTLNIQERETIYRRRHAFLEPLLICYIQQDMTHLRRVLRSLPSSSQRGALLSAITHENMNAMLKTQDDLRYVVSLLPETQQLPFLTKIGPEKINALINNDIYHLLYNIFPALHQSNRKAFLLILDEKILRSNTPMSFEIERLLSCLPDIQHEWLLNWLGRHLINHAIFDVVSLIDILSGLTISKYGVLLMMVEHLSSTILCVPPQDFNELFSKLSTIQRDALYSWLVILHHDKRHESLPLIVLLNAEDIRPNFSAFDLNLCLGRLDEKWHGILLSRLGKEKINAMIRDSDDLQDLLDVLASSQYNFIFKTLDVRKINHFIEDIDNRYIILHDPEQTEALYTEVQKYRQLQKEEAATQTQEEVDIVFPNRKMSLK